MHFKGLAVRVGMRAVAQSSSRRWILVTMVRDFAFISVMVLKSSYRSRLLDTASIRASKVVRFKDPEMEGLNGSRKNETKCLRQEAVGPVNRTGPMIIAMRSRGHDFADAQ